jgi:tRNA (adenine37-N6)-methyltransferase
MDPICFTPIGIVRSPHTDAASTPKQSESARGITGRVELAPEFAPGLADIAEFDYVWLLVHMHRVQEGRALWVPPDAGEQPEFPLQVVTARGEPAHGVFATRAPYRPNPIGLSLVRLVRIEGTTLHIEDVDLLDGTPVLDIKPYVPKLDNRQTERIGWFARRLR